MRLTLRTLDPGEVPGALIAEIDVLDVLDDLWEELALVAYNTAYGYDEATRRELLGTTYREGTGTYPFGQHILRFGRFEPGATDAVTDPPVWLWLDL